MDFFSKLFIINLQQKLRILPKHFVCSMRILQGNKKGLSWTIRHSQWPSIYNRHRCGTAMCKAALDLNLTWNLYCMVNTGNFYCSNFIQLSVVWFAVKILHTFVCFLLCASCVKLTRIVLFSIRFATMSDRKAVSHKLQHAGSESLSTGVS